MRFGGCTVYTYRLLGCLLRSWCRLLTLLTDWKAGLAVSAAAAHSTDAAMIARGLDLAFEESSCRRLRDL